MICRVCMGAADRKAPREEHCNQDGTRCDCQHRVLPKAISSGLFQQVQVDPLGRSFTGVHAIVYTEIGHVADETKEN